MRQITIRNDEWRLLVELVDDTADWCLLTESVAYAAARDGLMRIGLAEVTSDGLVATELGGRVRADEPPILSGLSRVWVEFAPGGRPRQWGVG